MVKGSRIKRPHQRHRDALGSSMKLHLRELTIGKTTYRIVTLRPGTRVTFSTNFFHETWHLVSDMRGARMLARLLWGLSYQRRPGTMVMVHGEHLAPTPFEAERSDPFLLLPAHLTHLNGEDFRQLKRQLIRLGPPSGSIRWMTFGLDVALQNNGRDPSSVNAERMWLQQGNHQGMWMQERMVRCGGFICYSAPAPILRRQSLHIHSLRVTEGNYANEMDYHFLAECSSKQSWYGDGEVQIFANYHERVAAATEARRQLLVHPCQPVLSETLQETISRRRDQIQRRRTRNRRRTAEKGLNW